MILPLSGKSCLHGLFLKTPPANSRQTRSSPSSPPPLCRAPSRLGSSASPQPHAGPRVAGALLPQASPTPRLPRSFPLLVPLLFPHGDPRRGEGSIFLRSTRRRPFPGPPPRRCGGGAEQQKWTREYAAKEATFGVGAHAGMLRCVNELANAVKVTMCGAKGGAAAAAPWWMLPVEVLLLWATRATRSAWSVPVAIALLGIAVRGRRMRRQSKAVARLRLVLDDKV
ncbi:uncharacterized protein [Triticum aestivum]|uniref:uncharacterized protein n=1 Tax=Triticum aestivum TaxID=4565 RepID=UPI001D027B12|nr:uncharacterized protein LOC123139207 [Triticum aestivum]